MGKLKTLAYIGTYAKWEMHQMIDVCFLHTCALVADKVVCYKDVTTLEYVNEMADKHGFKNSVKIKRIHIVRSNNKYVELIGLLHAAIVNIFLFFKNVRKDYIVYNYDNVFSLHAINFLNIFFHKKVLILCHDEMELLITNSGGILAKIKRFLVRGFFGKIKISKNLEFLVLGQSIYENLRDVLPADAYSHFHSIEHPYYFNTAKPSTNYEVPKTVGLVGVVSEAKGLKNFIMFVNAVSDKSLEIKINVIGRISTHEYDDFWKKKNVDITWKYLPREEMEKRIDKLDYILYFYPKESYKLIASGAVFDAVCMNKPILAIRNDFFNHVLNTIGYPSLLVDDVGELVSFIKKQVPLSYNINQFNGVDMFSPEANSKILKNILGIHE